MTGLEELLRTAADGPVSFDVDDVRRRVDQRRRRRKLQGTAMVALVLVGVTTLVFALRDQPSERVETAAVPAAAEDLVGRWQVTAYSAVGVPPAGVFLELSGDGTLVGHDGCNGFSAHWSVTDGRLEVADLAATKRSCPDQADMGLLTILGAGPTIETSDLAPAALTLRTASGFVVIVPAPESTTTSVGDDAATTTSLPVLAPAAPDAATSVVTRFMDRLREGDLSGAAELWSGYPEAFVDASTSEKVGFIEQLMADPAMVRILEGDPETFVTASWGWTSAAPVVTLLLPRTGDQPPVAIAFLAGISEEVGDTGRMLIQRLPEVADPMGAELAGSSVSAGQRLDLPGTPVEGGVRAYVNGREIPVDIDYEAMRMSITIPDDIEGDVAITLSVATPELPGAQAFAVTVLAP
jgi:heat shock protein HslJ